ncbi:hypothetical protein BGY98DRAFT_286189 [Russula aff. rugulosa BPL654]|nr:hypothetical protein BGY98DRAFT_286189 [Russula aff. rugulosa BPL654]
MPCVPSGAGSCRWALAAAVRVDRGSPNGNVMTLKVDDSVLAAGPVFKDDVRDSGGISLSGCPYRRREDFRIESMPRNYSQVVT